MKTENLILTIVVAFIFLFLLSGIFEMIGYGGYGMMRMFGGFGFMPFFGWLFMILIFVALVLFIAWLVKQLQNPQETKKVRRRR